MPDLEARISGWRRRMLAAGLASPAVLDELESHLRDAIEHHMQAGMEAQQAFDLAESQLGDARALNEEFEKSLANPSTLDPSMKPNSTEKLSIVLLASAVLLSAVAAPALIHSGLAPVCLYLSTLALLARAFVEWNRPEGRWLRGLFWMVAMLLLYGLIFPFWAKMHIHHGDAYPSVPMVDAGAVVLNALVVLLRPLVTIVLRKGKAA